MLRLDLQVRFDEHQQVALELQMVLTICVFGHPPTLQIHKISRGFTVVGSGAQQILEEKEKYAFPSRSLEF